MKMDGENEVYRSLLADGRSLVARDLGSPYDNMLFLHLVARDGDVLDCIEAGGLMADGIFKPVAAQSDRLDFTFFSNDRTYRLRWTEAPRWVAPFSLPTGFRYRRRFGRHFLDVVTLT